MEDDELLERLLIRLLCNLSGFKNNQQKLGGCMRVGHQLVERSLLATPTRVRPRGRDTKNQNQSWALSGGGAIWIFCTIGLKKSPGTSFLIVRKSVLEGARGVDGHSCQSGVFTSYWSAPFLSPEPPKVTHWQGRTEERIVRV